MFINRSRTYHGPITVHEHRAPTDESVKLLREMEQKAKDNIENLITIHTNGFKGSIIVQRDYSLDRLMATAIFKLNDKEMKVSTELFIWEHVKCSSEEINNKLLINLRNEVAKAISNEILMDGWQMAQDVI